MNDEIKLLTREDVLKALHNSYTEKYVSAVLAKLFYQERYEAHRKQKMTEMSPEKYKTFAKEKGEAYKTELEQAEENISRHAKILSYIHEHLQDLKKINEMGGIPEKRLDISGTS